MLDRDVLVPGTADRVLPRLTTFLLSVVLLIAVAVSLGGCRWNGGKSAVGGGQNGNIRGLVENESGVPVAGAQVRLDAGEATSQTDENGWFAFIGVPTGVWQILVAKEGYFPSRESVAVGASVTATVRASIASIASRLHGDSNRVPNGCADCHEGAHTGLGVGALKGGLASNDLCFTCHAQPGIEPATPFWPGQEMYTTNYKVYRTGNIVASGYLAPAVHFRPPAGSVVPKTYPGKSYQEGECLNCHTPHGVGDPETGLFASNLTWNEGEKLCYQCHQAQRLEFGSMPAAALPSDSDSRHSLGYGTTGLRCSSCHNPHVVTAERRVTNPKSEHRWELDWTPRPTQAHPYGYQWISQFCLRCHDGSWPGAKNILAELTDSNPHPEISSFYGKYRYQYRQQNLSRLANFHWLHASQYGPFGCTACHDPHTTSGSSGINRGRLLRADITITGFQDGFYPDGVNGCSTAAGCHDQKSDCQRCHTFGWR